MADIICFTNCKLCGGGELIEDDLWVENGIILDKQRTFYIDKKTPTRILDCHGLFLTPGLIDIQINGYIGVDFSDLSKPDEYVHHIQEVRYYLQQFGVTSFSPTIVTSDHHTYEKIEETMNRSANILKSNWFLGLHYEGPFLSPNSAGIHRKQLLRNAIKYQNLTDLYGAMKFVSYVTLAPEQVSEDVIPELVSRGFKVSIGHTQCDYEEALTSFDSGAACVTHMFSCIRPFHHRNPGIIGALTSEKAESVFYGLITDGVHLDDGAIRVAYRANKNLIAVTDASSIAGFDPGLYISYGQRVEVKEDRVVLEGTDTLAGSNASLLRCLRGLKRAGNLTVPETIKCATENPASFMGVGDRIGFLLPGRVANLVLMTEDFDVKSVYYEGELIYSKK